jgi:20S proteasome subunit alpha 5
LIDHARVEAQNYHFTYNEPIAVESITQSVCDIALRFGEDREGREDVMSRPYGVALLIGGIDERGPALFHTDPSGTFLQFYAKAIGSGYEGAQTQLEQSYHKSMTLKEAMILGATVLRQVMEEKLTPANIEVGIVEASTKKFRLLSGAEIEVRQSKSNPLVLACSIG